MAFQNAGELRKALLAEGLKWTVNPAFHDTASIPRYHLGGAPDQFPLALHAAKIDVNALVVAHPPANPFLVQELVEKKVLPATLMVRAGLPVIAALAARIIDWRNRWGEGDFPFLFVQLAPFTMILKEPGDTLSPCCRKRGVQWRMQYVRFELRASRSYR